MYRTIFGNLLAPDDSPHQNRPVTFRLTQPDQEGENLYLQEPVTIYTDANGYFSVELWVNELGGGYSNYEVTLPDCSAFEFTLPNGSTDPININVLREGGIVCSHPNYQTILNYLSQQVTNLVASIRDTLLQPDVILSLLSPNDIWTYIQNEILTSTFEQVFGDGNSQVFEIHHQLKVKYVDTIIVEVATDEIYYATIVFLDDDRLRIITEGIPPGVDQFKIICRI